MEFKKFSSLENTYRQNLIDKVQYEGKDVGLWMVTEKLHGANFSFWCDGKEVKTASRTQFVNGTFYNCQAVINRYEQGVLETWSSVCKEGDVLTIYGELFGGNVQKEVQYGEKDFKGFDVAVNGEIQEKVKAFGIIRFAGILTVPVIHIGSFKECMEINNTFKSLLTPEGYEGENISEGLVIEPVVPQWFNNGSRVYFKNKTAGFSEKNSTPKEKKVFALSEVESELMNEILEYNTTQRVSNVLSKFGTVTNKDFGKILGLTMQDLLEEFTKEAEKNPKQIAENNWKDFSKLLQAEVSKSVREQFVKLLD